MIWSIVRATDNLRCLCGRDRSPRRREDGLHHADHDLNSGDHVSGYRNLGLDDQSNGLPRRDHGLWNQDSFLRSGTRFLGI